MIKTAMILAAGRGERMRPLTNLLPKPLISVAGKPLIQYHLEKLASVGIKNVVINHAWLGHKIEEILGDGRQFDLQIQYSSETEALETAGGIVKAMPLLGDEPFLVLNGDVYCDVDLSQFCSESVAALDGSEGIGASATATALAVLLLVKNPQHNPFGDFALEDCSLVDSPLVDHPLVDQHLVNSLLVEKSEDKQSFTFSGIAVYKPEFFAGLSVEKLPLAPQIRRHMRKQRVLAQYYQGRWSDVGTPERLEELEMELSK